MNVKKKKHWREGGESVKKKLKPYMFGSLSPYVPIMLFIIYISLAIDGKK